MFYNKKPQQAPPAKKGGRPPKPNARTEKLSTRLSASEYLIVDAKIRQSGKDASAFIREMLLSGTVTEAPSAIVAQQIRQLNGGINNLNQLCHLAHASGILNVEPQIKELIDWFRDLKKNDCMIADIHKRESFSTIVNYANNQKKARLIDSRGVDTTSNATIATDMQWQSDQRKILGKRLVSEPVYHISLDFALEDRPKLNDDLLRQIAREYMQRMGIKDTQYIVCRHLDTDHVHLHIVANRVDDNFGCISDARDLERNVRVCKALTREYGLTLGKDKQKVKRSHLRGRDAAKYRIYDAIQSVLTPGIGWKDFCRSLKARGIETRFNVDQKTGQIVGVSFGQGRYSFAGSKIDAFTSFRHLDNFLNGGLGGGQGVGGSGRSGGQTAETPVSRESETQSFHTPVDTPMDLFAGANGTSDTDDGGTDGGNIVSVAADVIMEIAFQPHYTPAVGGGGGTGSDLKWRDDDREKNKHNTNHIRRSGRR